MPPKSQSTTTSKSHQPPSTKEAAGDALRWARANRTLRIGLREAALRLAVKVRGKSAIDELQTAALEYNSLELDDPQKKTLRDERNRAAARDGCPDVALILNVLRFWPGSQWQQGAQDAKQALAELVDLRDRVAKEPGAELAAPTYKQLLGQAHDALARVAQCAAPGNEFQAELLEELTKSEAAVDDQAWAVVFVERRRAALHAALARSTAHGDERAVVATSHQQLFLTRHCGESLAAADFLVEQLSLAPAIYERGALGGSDNDGTLACCLMGTISAVDLIVTLQGALRRALTDGATFGFLFALRCSATVPGSPFTLHLVSQSGKAHAVRVKLIATDAVDDSFRLRLCTAAAQAVDENGNKPSRDFADVFELLRWVRDEYRGGKNKPYRRLESLKAEYRAAAKSSRGRRAASSVAPPQTLSEEQRVARRSFLERIVLEAAEDDSAVGASFVGLRSAVDTMLMLMGQYDGQVMDGWLFAVRCSMSTPEHPFTVHLMRNGEHKVMRVALRAVLGSKVAEPSWYLAIETFRPWKNKTFASLIEVLKEFADNYNGKNTPYEPSRDVLTTYKDSF